jgi:hypothetical protein
MGAKLANMPMEARATDAVERRVRPTIGCQALDVTARAPY